MELGINMLPPNTLSLPGRQGPPSSNRSSSLPTTTVEYLKAWIMSPAHIAHPYPTDVEKSEIMRVTGIEMKQLTNWFTNNRKRFWKPRITAMQENGTIGNIKPPIPSSPLLEPGSPAHKTALSHLSLPPKSMDPFNLSSPQSSIVTPTSPSPMPVSELTALGSPKAGSTSSSASHQDVVAPTGTVTRYEIVDVYVLQPAIGPNPTIKDVTILSPKSPSRVLSSCLGKRICYTFHQSVANDRKRVQSRRDAEVVRVKKKLLREYLGSGVESEAGREVKREAKEPPIRKSRPKRVTADVAAARRPKTRNLTSNKRPRTVSGEMHAAAAVARVESTGFWGKVLKAEVGKGNGVGSGVMLASSSDSDSSCSTTELEVDREADAIDFDGEGGAFVLGSSNNTSTGPNDSTWWSVLTPRAEIVTKGGWREVMGRWDMGERELPTLEEAAVLFGFRKS
mmetsp:Transcript_13971/g.28623  ORF Transcript_13971/g.28623 Transcript_13971/m.28623 type:complete len:451 (+) Transcript_13971:136-1488(+)